ncbi:MAG: two-component system, OmpR family, sensor histidine kinase VicK [Candidatus Parcubacteria bacterium]|jgi:signal transduction histidine kinase|nr:two-component system, OmpR family, sensor histidine kinase VicK [Candidatus Parcubacteria bacterium]
MTIRVLLALLIILALAASLLISVVAGDLLASYAGPGGFLAWASAPLSPAIIVSVLTGAIISVIFFLIVNALVVRPLRAICSAMDAFANGAAHVKLPVFKGSPSEIRNFARIWSEFASRVEDSHSRDTEMSRVKSDFISTAAHQLRTPLTGIRWALEALEKEKLTESQAMLIKSAVDKSHDLVGIVGTLLDISSIESGKYKYQFVSDDIESLASEVATDFLPLAQRTGVILTYVPIGGLPKVRIDRERMKWVLNNLIENAIRYTPQGGSVQVSTVAVSGRVMVRVRDTGIGIHDQDRNNIFERFYRAGNAVAKDNQGNGLGLYIARSIVNDHRGDLSFEANAEGPGTTFTLALPSA